MGTTKSNTFYYNLITYILKYSIKNIDTHMCDFKFKNTLDY